MAKTRARVVIDTGLQSSELFSIIERANNDLVILPRRPAAVSGVGNGIADVAEFRLSFHVSPKSNGPLAVQHVRTQRGEYQRTYAKISVKDGTLSWPLLAMLCSNLDTPQYQCTHSKKDELLSIGQYSPYSAALVYCIVLTFAGEQLAYRPEYMSYSVFPYASFAVHLIWGFIPLISTHMSSSLFPETARTLEIAGREVDKYQRQVLTSRTPTELEMFIEGAMSGLSLKHVHNVRDLMNEEGGGVPLELLMQFRWVLDQPPPPPSDEVLRRNGFLREVDPE